MSICTCPSVPEDVQKQLIQNIIADPDWNLLCLQDMYNAGNSLEDIAQVIPFRGGPCARSVRCCGQCTHQCYHRCIQDCLHRLYMWRHMVQNTPADRVPLSIRLIVNQKFESLEDLSWVVGDIVSRKANAQLREFMKQEGMRPEENPYKMDYAPSEAIDPSTGRRAVNAQTGEIQIRRWPETGLCPYCLPNVLVDRRYTRSKNKVDGVSV